MNNWHGIHIGMTYEGAADILRKQNLRIVFVGFDDEEKMRCHKVGYSAGIPWNRNILEYTEGHLWFDDDSVIRIISEL